MDFHRVPVECQRVAETTDFRGNRHLTFPAGVARHVEYAPGDPALTWLGPAGA